MSIIYKDNNNNHNSGIIKKVTWYGLIINTILSIVKLLVGIYGSSQVVIADALHSFSDSLTDITIIVGVKYWTAPPDKNHPYGHQKIETVITALISIILITVAFAIAYDGIVTIEKKHNNMPTIVAVIGPVLSIIVKEVLYRWNVAVGKQIKSTALIANAWHHRSDVLSSILALITVSIALIDPNISFIDNVGAIIVALFILKVAWNLLSPAISDLTDKGVSTQTKKEIFELTTSIKGVKSAHAIRTRKNGSSILVDLHVLVDGNMTVTESHNITEEIQIKLMQKNPDIIDIVVHIEPATGNLHKN